MVTGWFPFVCFLGRGRQSSVQEVLHHWEQFHPPVSVQILEKSQFIYFLISIVFFFFFYLLCCDFPGDSDVTIFTKSTCNAGDLGSIPGSGRSPGEGNGNPLQYSSLENSMDRRAWQTTVQGISKSQTWVSLAVVDISCGMQDLVTWPEIEQGSNGSKESFF